jgi:catechol 2,3-dioxygenase-like lactoylglutathione lyase family enzyme
MAYDHADPEYAGQLHHVELCTSDFEASVGFWDWLLVDYLEYDLKNEWDEGRSWINGPSYIVLVQASEPDHRFDRQSPGLNHLAFHAASRKLVDEITVDIRKREDTTMLYEDQHPYAGGYYALYCESPEGMKVEVVAPE